VILDEQRSKKTSAEILFIEPSGTLNNGNEQLNTTNIIIRNNARQLQRLSIGETSFHGGELLAKALQSHRTIVSRDTQTDQNSDSIQFDRSTDGNGLSRTQTVILTCFIVDSRHLTEDSDE
jgi:hypothetical protein